MKERARELVTVARSCCVTKPREVAGTRDQRPGLGVSGRGWSALGA